MMGVNGTQQRKRMVTVPDEAVITVVRAPDDGCQRNSTTKADGNSPGWPVSEAVITVVRAPDDGCQHPKHVELSTEMW